MKFADLLKQSTASTSAAVITLGAAVSGFRTLAQAIADGELSAGDQSTFMVRDSAGKFEFSLFTVTNSTTLTRVAVRRSSNNNAAETFGTGAVVANIPDAEWLSQLLGAADGVELSSLPIVSSLVAGDQAVILRAGAAYLAPTSLLGSSAGAPADTTAPTAPTSLASSSVTQAGYTVTFTPGTDNVSVLRSEWSLDGSSWAPVAGGAAGNTFNVTGRAAGSTDTVRVRTVDTSGNVGPVATLSVTLQATAGSSDTQSPTWLAGSLTTTSVTSSGYTMNFPGGTDNVGVTVLESSIDGGATWTTHPAGTATRVVSGRPAATTDQLRARLKDAAGNVSNVLSATVTTAAAQQTNADRWSKVEAASFQQLTPATFSGGTAPNQYFAQDLKLLVVNPNDANDYPAANVIKAAWIRTAVGGARPTSLPPEFQWTGSAWPGGVPYNANGGSTSSNVPNSITTMGYFNQGGYPGVMNLASSLFGGGATGWYWPVVLFPDGSMRAASTYVAVT